MGNIKQTNLKRQAEKLVEQNDDKFSDDFNKNKEILKEMNVIPSKTNRNKIAGYIVKVIKNKNF